MRTTIDIDKGKKVLRKINKCIYCGELKDLSDEHVIPKSLRGTHVLKKASCAKHRDITSKYEGVVTGTNLLAVRMGLNIKKDKPNQEPKKFPVDILKNGKLQKTELPIGEQPQVLVLPKYGLPKYLVDPNDFLHTQGIERVETPYFAIVGGPRPENFLQWLDDNNFSGMQTDASTSPFEFALMLGKIAYCLAVGMFGLEAIEDPYILPAITLESNDIGRWVGCTDDVKYDLRSEGVHQMKINFDESYEVFVRIKLFSMFETPTYSIVVGKVDRELIDNFEQARGQEK